jgi:hydrogenase expression/formation protein HypE
MAELPAVGKISPELFQELVLPRLGSKDPGILARPRNGAGASIAEIGGQAVSFTAGPVLIMQEGGWDRAAWFAVHALASSSVTCGLPPKYLTIDLNLPVETTGEQLTLMWETLHRECEKLGIAVIAAHLARYENCQYPMVGGGTVVGVGGLDKYVSPEFIKPGDKIIITKGPALQAAGLFAATFPTYIENSLGKDVARKGRDIFYKMSVVTEALAAVTAGVRDDGVSAMRDAAEGGIWGGLFELAQAAGVGVRVDQDRIVIEPGVAEICRLYGIDPFTSISGGALIIACRPHKAEEVVRLIHRQGVRSSISGEFTLKEQGMVMLKGGNPRPLIRPAADPFWKAFSDTMARSKKTTVK